MEIWWSLVFQHCRYWCFPMLSVTEVVDMAAANSDFVLGFISQSRLCDDPQFIHMTPGISCFHSSIHVHTYNTNLSQTVIFITTMQFLIWMSSSESSQGQTNLMILTICPNNKSGKVDIRYTGYIWQNKVKMAKLGKNSWIMVNFA